MNDSWFNEYMFEIATHKKYVPQELVEAWEQEPIHLSPWDPMGALEREFENRPIESVVEVQKDGFVVS